MIVLTGATGAIGSELVAPLCAIDEVLGIARTIPSDGSTNDHVRYVHLDLEDVEAIRSFAKIHADVLQRVTVVHAAVHKADALVANVDVETWDRMMRVNLRANLLLNQTLLPRMMRERWGRIVHVSSLGGVQGRPGTVAYSTCKAGLIGLSNVLAQEYARFGITSNIIQIGYFESRLFRVLKENEQQRLLDSIPSKQLGDVANIANAISFLIRSPYVNGATINVDGGAR